MFTEGEHFVPAGNVPHSHYPIATACRDSLAIVREGDGGDRVTPGRKREQFAAGGIPHPGSFVHTCGDQMLSVRCERDVKELTGVSFKREHFAYLSVPYPCKAISAGGENLFSVRRESYGTDPVVSPFECKRFFANTCIPYLSVRIAAPG